VDVLAAANAIELDRDQVSARTGAVIALLAVRAEELDGPGCELELARPEESATLGALP